VGVRGKKKPFRINGLRRSLMIRASSSTAPSPLIHKSFLAFPGSPQGIHLTVCVTVSRGRHIAGNSLAPPRPRRGCCPAGEALIPDDLFPVAACIARGAPLSAADWVWPVSERVSAISETGCSVLVQVADRSNLELAFRTRRTIAGQFPRLLPLGGCFQSARTGADRPGASVQRQQ
jgi:hypothetical protein